MNAKNKCKMTMSGKHLWIVDIWNVLSGEISGSIEYKFPNPYKTNKCQACGMTEDRKRV